MSIHSLVHSINIPSSIHCVAGIILGVRSGKMSEMRSLPTKNSCPEIEAHRRNVHTQIPLQPNPSAQFPSLAVWVSPQAKTYHVWHGVIFLLGARSCAHTCLIQ